MNSNFLHRVGMTLACVIFLGLSACSSAPQTKVSGNLAQMSKDQTVAILPVLVTGKGQREAARLFRQTLHANLKQAQFDLMERFLVDSLIRQQNITPKTFKDVSPMEWGELLGADAVVISRMDKVSRSYLFIHSSIEIEVNVEMIDTRTGEVLWMAHQTEKDFSGIGKIPTGIAAAALAPIKFVTNKFNLQKMTRNLTTSITALVKQPETAGTENTFAKPVRAPKTEEHMARLNTVRTLPVVPVALDPTQAELPRATTLQEPQPKPLVPLRTYEARILTPRPTETDNWVYTLQVGAYKTKAYAQRLLKKLIAKGHNAFVSQAKKDDKPLYRVQVEHFETPKDARHFAQTFTRQEHLDHFVTRLTSK